jgi:hypothetical protein
MSELVLLFLEDNSLPSSALLLKEGRYEKYEDIVS